MENHNLYEDGIHLTVVHKRGGHTASNQYPHCVILSRRRPATRKEYFVNSACKNSPKSSITSAKPRTSSATAASSSTRSADQTYGAEGLLDKLPGCKGAYPNLVVPEIEQVILDYSLTMPTHRPLQVAQKLALQVSTSVRALCVACGNVTTRSPNTTACCVSRKPIGSRRLSSMMSKFAC